MGLGLARALVLVSGAAILIVETLAARLVAPHVGLTLESHTTAIGVALLGIAIGAHWGGRLADRAEPRRVIACGLVVGGVLILAIRPLINAVGPHLAPGPSSTIQLIALSTLAPVIALAMVAPAVVKARLTDLRESGSVVGSLSALGTIGALTGTFLTGFVFIATLPTRLILLVTATVCLAMAFVVARHRPRTTMKTALLAVFAAPGLLLLGDPCDVETAYYCARVEIAPGNAAARVLFLDDLRHSYVDLEDPTHLEFGYTRDFAAAIDASFAQGRALRAVHLGGGGFTMPRWLAATRPGTSSLVLEIDRTVVALGREQLGIGRIADLEIVLGDARTSLRQLPNGSADLVVGDAFGSRSVPWHLATREFVEEVARVLAPGGLYVLNVIDHHPNGFLRAEAATVMAVFEHVALLADTDQFGRGGGGNAVLVASMDRADVETLARRAAPDRVLTGRALDDLVEGARVLTDDFAPVDQLLTPFRGS